MLSFFQPVRHGGRRLAICLLLAISGGVFAAGESVVATADGAAAPAPRMAVGGDEAAAGLEPLTTQDIVRLIVPTIAIAEVLESPTEKYEPQLGDIVFREGLSEMSQWYMWFFKSRITHSCIVTQLEPTVKVTHCTIEKFVEGVHDSLFREWALDSRQLEVYRLKDPTPEKIAAVVRACAELRAEGILFDKTWDYEQAIAAPGKKRRMYCTILLVHAFRAADIELVPQPRVETDPVRKGILRMAGVRNMTLYTVDLFQNSAELELVTRFKAKAKVVSESVRVRSRIPGELTALEPPAPSRPPSERSIRELAGSQLPDLRQADIPSVVEYMRARPDPEARTIEGLARAVRGGR
ncbi:YiiX/YebB-like N1pC/P60 family cysteine hydrolase [Candidatus Sumerlaeota bacterium]